MSWFGYIWIGILVVIYIIITIKCIYDFITGIKVWGIKDSFKFWGTESWHWWIMIHLLILFFSSLTYFFHMIRG